MFPGLGLLGSAFSMWIFASIPLQLWSGTHLPPINLWYQVFIRWVSFIGYIVSGRDSGLFIARGQVHGSQLSVLLPTFIISVVHFFSWSLSHIIPRTLNAFFCNWKSHSDLLQENWQKPTQKHRLRVGDWFISSSLFFNAAAKRNSGATSLEVALPHFDLWTLVFLWLSQCRFLQPVGSNWLFRNLFCQ